jgi:hypothetical protein
MSEAELTFLGKSVPVNDSHAPKNGLACKRLLSPWEVQTVTDSEVRSDTETFLKGCPDLPLKR